MSNTTSTFPTHDGLNLFYQYRPAQKHEKAVLIFVHGLNEHSGRYEYPFAHFANDYSIYAFDFRGHGRSPGLRAYVNDFSEFVLDLKAFVEFVQRREIGKKIFLVGHSMGGQITLNYLGAYGGSGIAGFVTSSPNIRLGFSLNALELFLARVGNAVCPKIWVPNKIKPEMLSHIPEVVQAYKQDPLTSKRPRLRLICEIYKNQSEVLPPLAEHIRLPALMLHSGEDHICAKEGTEEFFARLASVDKTKKIYPGAYHELFNETLREEVFSDMQTWLERHL